MIKLSDNEIIHESPTAREIAREAVRVSRSRKKALKGIYGAVRAATIRESTRPRYLPHGAFQFWWEQDVIRPRVGAIEASLYPK